MTAVAAGVQAPQAGDVTFPIFMHANAGLIQSLRYIFIYDKNETREAQHADSQRRRS